MRVLFVTHAFPRWSGDPAGAFVQRLAQGLGEAGHAVDVMAPSAPGLPARHVIDGTPVWHFRYAPGAWETLAYVGTMAEQVRGSLRGKAALSGLVIRGSFALRKVVAAVQPDIVHAHWWFPSGLLALGGRIRQPLVTTLHGSDVRLARSNRLAPAVFRSVMDRSQAVTAVSTWLADEARAMAPGLTPLVEPMPVDTTLFSPGSETRQPPRFLFVGRLNAQKGAGLLLDALAATRSGAALDVVGEGEDGPSLRSKAVALGIDQRVTFHGALTQTRLVSLYRAAVAVVVPSEREGLGLVAVEAHLCETPVIAFRSGGLTDVVVDGETGLLTPPGDVRALALAMDSLLDGTDRGAAFGRAGRVAALGRFLPGAVAARYGAIYRRVIRHES